MHTEVHHRPFATFLSHAHADSARTDRLYQWLTERCGFDVWYDKAELQGAQTIPAALSGAIDQCRTILIALTKQSVESGWVREEIEAALSQRAADSDFRVIPLLLEDCEVPGQLRSTRWIDLREPELTAEAAVELIKAFYGKGFTSVVSCDRDVYLAAGWREGEEATNQQVVTRLAQRGLRAIGDSKDQQGFDRNDRVSTLIGSCGALLAVLPDRGGGLTSRYIIDEIIIAQDLGLPVFIIADQGVDMDKSIAVARAKGNGAPSAYERVAELPVRRIDQDMSLVLEDLVEDFRPPQAPHYIFFSHKFKHVDPELYRLAKQVISGITCMPCEDGDDIAEGNISQTIIRRIRGAFLLLADVSEDNINSCIEAGIGFGAGVTVKLLARGDRHRPAPFMFRNEQVIYFDSNAELVGSLHKSLRPYRRRDISAELPN